MQRQRLVTRACIEDRTAAREAHEVGRDKRRDDRLAKARRALRDAAIRAQEIDADGYLVFIDRRKNVIRRSGENIAAMAEERTATSPPSAP